MRQGAKLGAADKQQLSKINQELAGAFSDFATKVLADEDTWIALDSEADLAGLPPALVSAYKAAADGAQGSPASGRSSTPARRSTRS